ncbi:sigma factor-like helix-turn-helix DNA-binding protein, partial [Chloroflexota bacterium]
MAEKTDSTVKHDQSRVTAMYRMRQSGASLDQIAVRFGISRERVRQLLVRHHGSTRLGDLLTVTELRHRAGCTYNDILKLKRLGIIQSAKVVGFDPLPSLEVIDIPGFWMFGSQDRSIPVALSVENLDTLVAQHGKDFSYIIYPNADHSLRDTNTSQFFPAMSDAASWIVEK